MEYASLMLASETKEFIEERLMELMVALLPPTAEGIIKYEAEQDRLANPHNDGYGKRKRRDYQMIDIECRVKQMLLIKAEIARQLKEQKVKWVH